VRDALPQRSVTEIIAPVSAVELNLRQPAELDGDVGVLAHVVGVLAHQGIAIQDVATCTPDGLIFVPEDQAVAAYEFANELLRPEEEPNARDR